MSKFPIVKSRHSNIGGNILQQAALLQMRNQSSLEQLQPKEDIGRQSKLLGIQQKASLESGQDLGKILNLSDNLISSLKSANLQQEGGGPLHGIVGNFATAIGQDNTGNIKALKNVKRDTALAYSSIFSRSGRAIATIFENVLNSIPDNRFTPEQAGSTMAELNLTAYGLKKGIEESGLNQNQIDNLTPDSAVEILSRGRGLVSPEETKSIYDGLSKKFKNIQPRPQIDLSGNVSTPQANPLSKFIFGGNRNRQTTKVFHSEEEAIKSGYKGKAIINGRQARID